MQYGAFTSRSISFFEADGANISEWRAEGTQRTLRDFCSSSAPINKAATKKNLDSQVPKIGTADPSGSALRALGNLFLSSRQVACKSVH